MSLPPSLVELRRTSRSSGLRLLRPIHTTDCCKHFSGRPLCDGIAISAPPFLLVFENTGAKQCGAIFRAELGRLLIQFLKASWERKNAGVGTAKAGQPCNRFEYQFIRTCCRDFVAFAMLSPWIAWIEAGGGDDADVKRDRLTAEARGKDIAPRIIFQVKGN